MRLNEWQQAFADLLQHGDSALEPHIFSTSAFKAQERLQVYRNNYRQAAMGALRHSYELCLACVGEDYFGQLAHNYVEQHPVKQANLNHYGADFPSHLESLSASRPELQKLAWLPDLARLDWCCYQLYYAVDAQDWPGHTFAKLASGDQARIRLQLAPDCQLLDSYWPLHHIWQVLKEERDNASTERTQQSYGYIIKRDGYHARPVFLQDDIYKALQDVEKGVPLERLSAGHPQAIKQLPQWIRNGWIDDFST